MGEHTFFIPLAVLLLSFAPNIEPIMTSLEVLHPVAFSDTQGLLIQPQRMARTTTVMQTVIPSPCTANAVILCHCQGKSGNCKVNTPLIASGERRKYILNGSNSRS